MLCIGGFQVFASKETTKQNLLLVTTIWMGRFAQNIVFSAMKNTKLCPLTIPKHARTMLDLDLLHSSHIFSLLMNIYFSNVLKWSY